MKFILNHRWLRPDETLAALAKLSRQIRQRKEKLLSKRCGGTEECKPWNRSHQTLSTPTA